MEGPFSTTQLKWVEFHDILRFEAVISMSVCSNFRLEEVFMSELLMCQSAIQLLQKMRPFHW